MNILSSGVLTQINFWAVLVAAVLSFFLGGLWYSPALFEEAWMQANGYDGEQVKQVQTALGPLGFGTAFAAYLAMALVFALVAAALGVSGAFAGVVLALLVWAGFVASTGLTVNLFSVRPLSAWLIDAGFQFVFLVTMGLVIGQWR